jgi:hypothetical protein
MLQVANVKLDCQSREDVVANRDNYIYPYSRRNLHLESAGEYQVRLLI